MKRNVVITVSGLLYMGTGEREEDYIDVITPGKYYWRDDRHYLMYEEQMGEAGMTIRNRITLEPGRIAIRKTGFVKTEMVFALKQETITWYSTPYGEMEMNIYTNRITMSEGEEELRAEVRYKLDMGTGGMDCFVKILVQAQNPPEDQGRSSAEEAAPEDRGRSSGEATGPEDGHPACP